MAVHRTALLVLVSIASASTFLQADPLISETFSGYPDNALISAHPAGPAVGLAGDWDLAPGNFFYVNRTEADLGAGTGKAVYDMPWDDNGARTAQRSTSANHLVLAGDGDTLYASFLVRPARLDGTMLFGLALETADGAGQPSLSFGINGGAFTVGNGGVNVDVLGGTPSAQEMLIVLRVEYGDSGTGPDDAEVVTLWVDPQGEAADPVIDREPADLLNRGGARITGVFMRGEQMAGQPAYFDNLRVGLAFDDVTDELPAGGLTNDLGMNGLFYDPANPGHGFNFVVHRMGLTIFYYGHAADGGRLWLVSDNHLADLEFGHPIIVDMHEVPAGAFGTPQLPATPWGSVTVNLADCDTGHASLDGLDGNLDMDLVRLTGMPGITCQ